MRNLAVRLLEFVGCMLRGPGRSEDLARIEPKTILFCRTDHIGDVLLTLPSLSWVRSRYPRARITLLIASWSQSVVRVGEFCDEVIVCDPPWWTKLRSRRFGGSKRSNWMHMLQIVQVLRRRRFDLCIESRGDVRQMFFFGVLGGAARILSRDRHGGARLADCALVIDDGLHEIDQNLKVVSALGTVRDWAFPVAYRPFDFLDLEIIDDLLKGFDPTAPLVVVHPGAKLVNAWPLGNWLAWMDAISKVLPANFIVTGAPSETSLCETLSAGLKNRRNVAGRLSLASVAALMSRAALVAMADTGPMHFLHFVPTPALLLFGPTPASRFAPNGKHVHVVSADFCCQASLHETCLRLGCDYTSACMASIAVTPVVDAALRLLSTGPKVSGTGRQGEICLVLPPVGPCAD